MLETHVLFRDVGQVTYETIEIEKKALKDDEVRIEPSYYPP